MWLCPHRLASGSPSVPGRVWRETCHSRPLGAIIGDGSHRRVAPFLRAFRPLYPGVLKTSYQTAAGKNRLDGISAWPNVTYSTHSLMLSRASNDGTGSARP